MNHSVADSQLTERGQPCPRGHGEVSARADKVVRAPMRFLNVDSAGAQLGRVLCGARDRISSRILCAIAARGSILRLLRSWLGFVVICACLASWEGLHAAESPEETRAFNAALQAYGLLAFERAEAAFADFVQKFSDSERVPEATLRRAQALVELKNFPGALKLLTKNQGRAGVLADQYQLWLAQAQYQSGNYVAAAPAFAALLTDFPNSPLRLEAAYCEAQARAKLRDWPRAIDLLQNPESAFQKIAATRTNDDLVVRGRLLLAEALLERRDVRGAQETLDQLSPQKNLDLDWHRQFLLCRTLLASGLPELALANTTNLLAAASTTAQRGLIAESYALQGDILEQLNQYEAAVAAYEQNLAASPLADKQRQAFLRIIELLLAQNNVTEASKRLDKFSASYTNDAASDIGLLTLGELRLKQHYLSLGAATNIGAPGTSLPATNLVEQALAQFDKLLKDFPQSPWTNKAQLNRGWCFWARGKILESLAPFRAAAEQLPFSEDQAVARFKLADAQFQQNDWTNALRNYRVVVSDYARWERVRDELADHALYQILRISLALGDEPGATNAMRAVLDNFPQSPFANRGVLLLGQALIQWNKPAEARALFEQFVQKFPHSSLLPEVQLAIARTYVEEQNWQAAVTKYEAIAGTNAAPQVRSKADYYRGLTYWKADLATNALSVFTNFLAEFPTNELAPRAQTWVADFYFNQKNYFLAQKEYQRVFENTNWPISELTFQARLTAGKAAYALSDYKAAADHFSTLINNLRTPTNVVPVALFALGDTRTAEPVTNLVQKFDNYAEAIRTFSKIIQSYPAHGLVPAAWGRIGHCYLQLGAQEPGNYEKATNAYAQATAFPTGSVALRSEAEVGWGIVLEKMAEKKTGPEREALLKEAMNHYLNVVTESNLNPAKGEKLDPFWFKKAAEEAARLAEASRQWDQAIRLYARVIDVLPATRPALDKRIASARLQQSSEKK